MEEKRLDKITAFDTIFTTNSIQMLKIFITYLEPSMQKMFAIYIKYMELQYTISFFNRYPGASTGTLPHEETSDMTKLCDELLPLCPPAQKKQLLSMKNMIQNWKNMQEMMEMIQTLKELFPEGSNPMEMMAAENPFSDDKEENFMNGNPLASLMGMSGMDLSQIFELFQGK